MRFFGSVNSDSAFNDKFDFRHVLRFMEKIPVCATFPNTCRKNEKLDTYPSLGLGACRFGKRSLNVSAQNCRQMRLIKTPPTV